MGVVGGAPGLGEMMGRLFLQKVRASSSVICLACIR